MSAWAGGHFGIQRLSDRASLLRRSLLARPLSFWLQVICQATQYRITDRALLTLRTVVQISMIMPRFLEPVPWHGERRLLPGEFAKWLTNWPANRNRLRTCQHSPNGTRGSTRNAK